MSIDFTNQTASQLRKHLDSKEISATELTKIYLKRIKDIDPKLNSIITICEEHALQNAKQADKDIMAGNIKPLTGIPIIHKDIFCTKGIKTTCGSKMLANFTPPYSATVFDKIQAAGAIMIAKASMDEFAMGSSNEYSYFGACANPWNIKYVPGGSSGGSAAAVAAGLAPLATGTDTGGSIRQPAAYCGITGLKPTYGRVSRYGMVAFASSLDQAGPMTRSAKCAGLMLNAMAGQDWRDGTSLPNPPENDYTDGIDKPITGMKIGIPREYFRGDSLSAPVAKAIDEAIEKYKELGAEFVEVRLPHSYLCVPAYYTLAPAECSSNLSRFDGVHYGHRAKEIESLDELYIKSRTEGFGPEVKRRILIGTYTLSSGHYDTLYINAQRIRQWIIDDFNDAFKRCDAIIAPVTLDTAYEIGSKVNDPVAMYKGDLFTIPVNLARLPAISFPIGFGNGLPIGIQLIGPLLQEKRLIHMAHQFQLNTDWHLQVPEIAKLTGEG